jgi:hypothetical protein
MSYETQSQLEADNTFQQRNRAVTLQQAHIYKDDARADFVALANAVMRDDPGPWSTFTRLAAAGPGIADKVTTDDGIDSSLVPDEDLLALTQGNWPTVAGLYFDAEGNPIGATL